jgi:hypothetical protein
MVINRTHVSGFIAVTHALAPMNLGEFAVMYKKLLPLVNHFVYIRQGAFNRYYEGKMIEVLSDCISLQAYDDEGNPEAVWVIGLGTITEFMVGDRDLDELNIRVSMAKTKNAMEQQEAEDTVEQLNLAAAIALQEPATTLLGVTTATVPTSNELAFSSVLPKHDNNGEAGPEAMAC